MCHTCTVVDGVTRVVPQLIAPHQLSVNTNPISMDFFASSRESIHFPATTAAFSADSSHTRRRSSASWTLASAPHEVFRRRRRGMSTLLSTNCPTVTPSGRSALDVSQPSACQHADDPSSFPECCTLSWSCCAPFARRFRTLLPPRRQFPHGNHRAPSSAAAFPRCKQHFRSAEECFSRSEDLGVHCFHAAAIFLRALLPESGEHKWHRKFTSWATSFV